MMVDRSGGKVDRARLPCSFGVEVESHLFGAQDVVPDDSEADAGNRGWQALDDPSKHEHDRRQDKKNVGYCCVAQFWLLWVCGRSSGRLAAQAVGVCISTWSVAASPSPQRGGFRQGKTSLEACPRKH